MNRLPDKPPVPPGKTPLVMIRADVLDTKRLQSWGLVICVEDCLTAEDLARELDDAFAKLRTKLDEVTK